MVEFRKWQKKLLEFQAERSLRNEDISYLLWRHLVGPARLLIEDLSAVDAAASDGLPRIWRRLGRVFDCPPLDRWHLIHGQWERAQRKRGQSMKSWTKTIRMLRQLVQRLDDRTRLSDQLLGSRMLRDSVLPRHWQARVYWRTNGELCPDKVEYYLCDLFATYHELELEMMAIDSRPSRAFPKPPPPRLCPEVQRSRPGDAEHRGANLGSSPAGWLGPDPTVWTPLDNQPRLDCYCPRGDRYPLSTEQRQDTSNVLE